RGRSVPGRGAHDCPAPRRRVRSDRPRPTRSGRLARRHRRHAAPRAGRRRRRRRHRVHRRARAPDARRPRDRARREPSRQHRAAQGRPGHRRERGPRLRDARRRQADGGARPPASRHAPRRRAATGGHGRRADRRHPSRGPGAAARCVSGASQRAVVTGGRRSSWLLPTRRLAFVLLASVGLAVWGGFAPGPRLVLFAIDGALALAVVVDALFALGPRVELDRQVAGIFSVGRPNLVTLHVRSRTWRRLTAIVADDPLDGCVATGNPVSIGIAPGGSTTVRYELVPSHRGPRALGGVTIRYPSPLGLVARQDRVLLPSTVDVYPDVHAARALELLRRQGRDGARTGSLRVRGGDTEFERLRPYQRGDEVRHVDWRASARRDDLTVRQFQTESNQNIVFALDVGRGMRGETHGETRGLDALTALDHALNAALLTADVALRGGDRAGLLVFDDAPRSFVAPAMGRSAGLRLTRAVYALEAGFAATDYRSAVTYFRSQVRARSLLVLFTNLLDRRSASELAASVRGLMPQHVPLCVLMRDTEVEAMAVRPASGAEGLYVRAAAAETLAWRDSLIRGLRRSGALVLDTKPNELTPELVRTYLEVKTRRLL